MGEAILYTSLGLILAFYIAWNLGANDAANPTDTAVGAGAVSLRNAILLFSAFALLGALLQGYMVIKTIGKGVVRDVPPLGALVASLAAGLWITLATNKGMPVSTTHSTVGAVLGIGLASELLGRQAKINLAVVYKVVLSWVVSPALAILLAAMFYWILSRLAAWMTSTGRNVDRFFKYFLIFNLAFSAYAFGTNDVGNATGVYVSAVSSVTGMPDKATMFYLALLGAIGIMLGAFTWGKKVISTVGFKITRLDYVSGAAAELSNALVVWLFSTIPKMLYGYGMPISTTHASVSSIIGVGLAKTRSMRGVDWRTVGLIAASWVLTLPVAMGISASLYILLVHMLG